MQTGMRRKGGSVWERQRRILEEWIPELSYDTWVGIGRKRRGDEYSREGYGKDKGSDM